jgi:hypothetical protein
MGDVILKLFLRKIFSPVLPILIMNGILKISKVSFLYIAIGSIISCSNNTEKQSNTSAASTPTTAEATPSEKPQTPIVKFKVNGVDANTKVGTGNDKAEHIGIVNGSSRYLSFVLNGDEAKFPFRGSLTMGLDKFDFKNGTYQCTATFSRYQRPNAAGELQYDSQRGGSFTLIFSSLKKSSEANGVGQMYEATGTFSGKMGLKMGFQADVKNIEITEGYFEKVPIQVYGNN